MKRTIYLITLLLTASLFTQTLSAQGKAAEAKKYFATTLSTKAVMDLIKTSLPTREECALVFSGENADTYYKMVQDVSAKLATEQVHNNENFVDNTIESFTTEDVIAGKGNYAGGMKNIESRLKPNVVFYKLELLREKGATSGMAYKYWVFVNNRWIYLPKPWSAFKQG
ncbi:MAG: hypothetical protein K0S33_1268 [Bacteroidetes bacterium]|jgi:hypothetical protein|nr:hypothetical protein [Bacteroidota bacterium]